MHGAFPAASPSIRRRVLAGAAGGKDRAHPYPVATHVLDRTIALGMKSAVRNAKLGNEEVELAAIRRLDDQARRLERSVTGPSLAVVIAEERARSARIWRGRSVFGWEPPGASGHGAGGEILMGGLSDLFLIRSSDLGVRTQPVRLRLGLAAMRDFLTEAEERAIVAAIDARPIRRRSASTIGPASGGRFPAADEGPMTSTPDVCGKAIRFLAIGCCRSETARHCLPGCRLTRPGQTLLIRYDPGAGIGWHKDRPNFGEHVVGVSLGARATMRFWRRRDGGFESAQRCRLYPAGPINTLRGEARDEWEHSITGA